MLHQWARHSTAHRMPRDRCTCLVTTAPTGIFAVQHWFWFTCWRGNVLSPHNHLVVLAIHSILTVTRCPTVPPLSSLVTDAIRFTTVHRLSCKPFGYTRPPVLVTLALLNPSPTSTCLWSLRHCARCLPLLSLSLCETRAAATPGGPREGFTQGEVRGGLEGS